MLEDQLLFQISYACLYIFLQILAWVCRGSVWNILLQMVVICVMCNNVQCSICGNSQCVLGDAGQLSCSMADVRLPQ